MSQESCLIPGDVSHMRISDHEAAMALRRQQYQIGANRFYSSSPQPSRIFSRHTTQGATDRAAAATACTLAKACESGRSAHLGALLLDILVGELYGHRLLGGLAVQHQERGAARPCRQRSAAGLLTWQPCMQDPLRTHHICRVAATPG